MGVITETLRVDGTEKAGRDLARLGEQADATSAAMGGTNSSMAAIAQQMPDVVTQLASGGNAFQVLVQQGLQVVQSNQALLASLTSLGPVLGALAAVTAEAYIAYRVLTMEESEAAATADILTEATRNLYDWSETQRQATIDLAEATGQLTAAEAARARNAMQMQAAWLQSTADLRAKQAELRKEQESLTTQAVDLVGGVLDVVDVFGVNSAVFDAFTTDSKELQTQLDAVNAVIATQTEEARKTTEALDKASDAKAKATERSKAHKDALREEERAAKEAAVAFADIIAMEDRFAAQERAAAEAKMAAEAAQRAADQQAAQRARELAVQRVAGSTLEAQLSGFGPGAGMGAGIAGALLGGGGIGAALNVVLPPPWGQIAAALVGLLGNDGAGAIKDLLSGIFGMVDNVLTALPQVLMQLMDYLPGLIITLAESLGPLVEGLLVGAGELVVELIDALPSIIVALVQAVPQIVAGLVRGLGVLVVDLVRAIVVELPQALAELLRGLLTIDNAGPFRGTGKTWRDEWRSSGRGDGLNITINGMVGDGARLGAGIRGLFDRDFGRVRARS